MKTWKEVERRLQAQADETWKLSSDLMELRTSAIGGNVLLNIIDYVQTAATNLGNARTVADDEAYDE
jgi:hypothetical protein